MVQEFQDALTLSERRSFIKYPSDSHKMPLVALLRMETHPLEQLELEQRLDAEGTPLENQFLLKHGSAQEFMNKYAWLDVKLEADMSITLHLKDPDALYEHFRTQKKSRLYDGALRGEMLETMYEPTGSINRIADGLTRLRPYAMPPASHAMSTIAVWQELSKNYLNGLPFNSKVPMRRNDTRVYIPFMDLIQGMAGQARSMEADIKQFIQDLAPDKIPDVENRGILQILKAQLRGGWDDDFGGEFFRGLEKIGEAAARFSHQQKKEAARDKE